MPKTNHQKQRDHIAAKKAQGLRRIVLRVRPEDADAHRIAAEQPQALNRIRRNVEARIEPETWDKVAARLDRRTERALLAQRRAWARRQQAGSNRPPDMIRFARRPPGAVRNRLKASGWWYDPVAAVWHLPKDPKAWPATEAVHPYMAPPCQAQYLSTPKTGNRRRFSRGPQSAVIRFTRDEALALRAA